MKVRTVGVGAPYRIEKGWAYTYYIDGTLYYADKDLSDSPRGALQKMREKVAQLRKKHGLTWRQA
jgi:hypothetical protein